MTADAASPPDVSIVVPVFNEQGAVVSLAREIAAAFAGWRFEIIFVDDASEDATPARLREARKEIPALRVLAHGRNAGQSRAIRTGVLALRRAPGGYPGWRRPERPGRRAAPGRALQTASPRVGLIGGERRIRRDPRGKRWASRMANAVRRRLLEDGADDTGCGLKAFRREAFLALPYFDHLHRYLPALMIREGYQVAFEPVNHRPRESGRSKYTNLGRLGAALVDLGGVIWLNRRARDPGGVEEAPLPTSGEGA